MTADEFLAKFDGEGRYLPGEGVEEVVFTTIGRAQLPGRLTFAGGLCVRAEFDTGTELGAPAGKAVTGIALSLDFGDPEPLAVVLHEGRVVRARGADGPSTRDQFLRNLARARALLAHGRPAATQPPAWLAAESVGGFRAEDFRDLDAGLRGEVGASIREFLGAARPAPPNPAVASQRDRTAEAALRHLLAVLGPLLPGPPPPVSPEAVLAGVEFPAWVATWDCEDGSDSTGESAVWLSLYSEEQAMPWARLGREAADISGAARRALVEAGLERQVYVRVKAIRRSEAVAG